MNRKEQAQKTKNIIFETSVNLFNKYGFQNVTINNICQQANIAKGTFYIYYESKEAIIKESYYQNLNTYLTNYFHSEIICSDETNAEKISKFLNAELLFASKIGIEITTLAYSFNLQESLRDNDSHFKKRVTSIFLTDLIKYSKIVKNYDREFVFYSLESYVRGLMATWCFSNGKFDLINIGKISISELVNLYILD